MTEGEREIHENNERLRKNLKENEKQRAQEVRFLVVLFIAMFFFFVMTFTLGCTQKPKGKNFRKYKNCRRACVYSGNKINDCYRHCNGQ